MATNILGCMYTYNIFYFTVSTRLDLVAMSSGKSVDKCPYSKFRVANMWPIWDQGDPGEPHVGPMNFAIWGHFSSIRISWNLI